MKDGSKTKAKKRSWFSYCLQVAGVVVILLPILLYTAVTLISLSDTSFALKVGQMTADWQYPLQRTVRFISLPLHRIMDLTKLSAWECMVENPLYVPGTMWNVID